MRYSRSIIAGLAAAGLMLGQSAAPTYGGTVRDIESKKGLPNLTVKLVPPNGSKAPELATATDAYGNFFLPAARAGNKYLLEVYSGLTPVYREVITPARGGRAEILLKTAGAKPTQVTVPAKERWTKTNVEVSKAEMITFNAVGEIRWGAGADGVAGPGGSTKKLGGMLISYPVKTIGAGGLIGRIGTGGPAFKIGASAAITADASGTIYLGINDNSYSDNSGEFQVAITKRAK